MKDSCYCGRPVAFSQCCQPYIQQQQIAPDAESLMRSRFSAYANKDYQYIVDTYAEAQRQSLTLNDIQQSAEDTQWLGLQVEDHHTNADTAQVTFKAFYRSGNQYFFMRECSDFIREQGQWRYTTGSMLEGTGEVKPGRNDPCPCGSDKKFKKCCG